MVLFTVDESKTIWLPRTNPSASHGEQHADIFALSWLFCFCFCSFFLDVYALVDAGEQKTSQIIGFR